MPADARLVGLLAAFAFAAATLALPAEAQQVVTGIAPSTSSGTKVFPSFGHDPRPAPTGFSMEVPPAFIGAEGAFETEAPDLVVTLRGGARTAPAYPGSDDMDAKPTAEARLDYIRFPNGFDVRSGDALGYRPGLGVRSSVRYIRPRNASRHEEIRGLDNLPRTIEAGLGLGYEQRSYRVFADLRYGVIGAHSWVGEAGADAIAYPMSGLTLSAGPRLGFSSDRFAETYFGIDPDAAARSGKPEFDASGGLTSAGVTVTARYLLNERWGVEGQASWDRLLSDAADSPITRAGSEDQYSLSLGLTRRISLDF